MDSEEDVSEDGVVDARDCTGPQGPQGPQGEVGPAGAGGVLEWWSGLLTIWETDPYSEIGQLQCPDGYSIVSGGYYLSPTWDWEGYAEVYSVTRDTFFFNGWQVKWNAAPPHEWYLEILCVRLAAP